MIGRCSPNIRKSHFTIVDYINTLRKIIQTLDWDGSVPDRNIFTSLR